ncbi:uncharacterized protein LOC133830585 [Humulus lupulus]|uniref:uncharacterized protein LOC133830585 n=1 Tax=Humulus lupulus TaxID=3486 RepID=UPI002B41557C|nr:uncharacterized protein LOC133830585 [Humulus lupulus]
MSRLLYDIPGQLKNLWDLWNLRCCIMLSLFLQAILILFATFRDRNRRIWFITTIWLAYLLADWVAAIAIGLITQSQGEDETCESKSHEMYDKDLFAFWASFLLLHLGGPDTITSFALEDNQFWLRHFFGLILQGLSAIYCFYLTLPKNKLWLPTLIVFMVGVIKYLERTMAFYFASLDHFGSTTLPIADPGPDYEEASTIYSSNLLQFSTEEEMMSSMGSSISYDNDFDYDVRKIDGSSVISEEITLLKVAHKLFEKFKGLIVGFYLTSKDRELSKSLFMRDDVNAKYAFRIIEYELSFMFHVLHTKVVVVRQKVGYFLRAFSFSSLLGSCIFFFLVDKEGFGRIEVALTYALLIGAIFLDAISIIMLVFSQWTFVSLDVQKKNWSKYIPACVLKRPRWSSSVLQYNMIDYCLTECRLSWFYIIAGYIRASDFLDKIRVMYFSTFKNVDNDLKEIIFNDLTRKSRQASSLKEAMEACQQRGDAALMYVSTTTTSTTSTTSSSSDFSIYIKLKWSISEFQYTESLLLWHIATEICFVDDGKASSSDEIKNCKIISEYMFYLLVMQPAMLAPVLGNWHLVFRDTCAEAKRFFKKYTISDHEKAIEKMNNVKTKFRPTAVKGVKSKSLFFDACILAKQLQTLNNNKWKVMISMWMEFMSYAATNCQPIVHAQQPSKGGELLTFTWLLMNHLGLGTQFSEEESGTKMATVK